MYMYVPAVRLSDRAREARGRCGCSGLNGVGGGSHAGGGLGLVRTTTRWLSQARRHQLPLLAPKSMR